MPEVGAVDAKPWPRLSAVILRKWMALLRACLLAMLGLGALGASGAQAAAAAAAAAAPPPALLYASRTSQHWWSEQGADFKAQVNL